MIVRESYEEHRDKLLKEVDRLRNKYGSEDKLNSIIKLYIVIFTTVSIFIYFLYIMSIIPNNNCLVVSIVIIAWIEIMAVIITIGLIKRYGDIYWINKLYDSIGSSMIDNNIIDVIDGYYDREYEIGEWCEICTEIEKIYGNRAKVKIRNGEMKSINIGKGYSKGDRVRLLVSKLGRGFYIPIEVYKNEV